MKATKAEREYFERVRALGCFIANHECGGNLEVHHKTGGGMALKSGNYSVMCLCFNHHSAQTPLPFGGSVHKGTKSFEKRYLTQDEMIEITKQRLFFNQPEEIKK